MHTPWQDLPEKMRRTILYGLNGEPIKMTYDDGLRKYTTERPFEGVLPNMERRFPQTASPWVQEELGPSQRRHTPEGSSAPPPHPPAPPPQHPHPTTHP